MRKRAIVLFRHVIKTGWFRQTIKLILDGQLGVLAWLILYDFLPGMPFVFEDLIAWFCIVVLCGAIFKVTRQHYRMIGNRDFDRIVLATLLAFGLTAMFHKLVHKQVASQMYIFLFLVAFLTGSFWATSRLLIRSLYEGRIPFAPAFRDGAPDALRTLVVGAGRAGFMVAEELALHTELRSKLVGFVDDALEKQGLRIQGIPVLGTTELIPTIVQEFGIERIILAIPSASGPVIRRMRMMARATGVELKTVPGIYNLLGNQAWRPEIRDISIDDLLRRDPIVLDQTALGQALKDAVVLITGGGGSIGSELARQVAAYHPARIVLLGRGEHSLWEIQRELSALFPGLPLTIELCDIRLPTRLHQVFLRWRPRVVFHAAAHKHVPFLELNPEEAVDNNVFGTRNVVQAALDAETRVFVNISTDKSVNPTNALGVSKCIAESIVCRASAKAKPGSQYLSVRFGNVLGSRGSVIPIFKEQILKGGPITITDPEMTRYFMTIPEASQLVLQAGLLGETGKVYVLDMGEPVRILDLATDMIALSGVEEHQSIDIQFTGIRPGEKLFEELFNNQECRLAKVHPKVFEATIEPLAPDVLASGLEALHLALEIDEDEPRKVAILDTFLRLIPSYTPSPTGLGAYRSAPVGEPLPAR